MITCFDRSRNRLPIIIVFNKIRLMRNVRSNLFFFFLQRLDGSIVIGIEIMRARVCIQTSMCSVRTIVVVSPFSSITSQMF